jgi:transposase
MRAIATGGALKSGAAPRRLDLDSGTRRARMMAEWSRRPLFLLADGGYQGPQFAKALAKVLPHLDVEIVKRSDRVSGFVVLPKRWIIEHSIARLNRCRRLAKDWENLNRKALAFLRLASIRLMLRKLCNPA